MLNFGEPEEATLEAVTPFLERIFYNNAPLEAFATDAERQARSEMLAQRRAPGLVADYERIGGSPLAAQARQQAVMVEVALRERGHAVKSYVGMQFTEPTIAEAVASAHRDGVTRLIGLPVFPLCGTSTNVAALNDVQKALDAMGWDVPFHPITGWHFHPKYVTLRTENIRQYAEDEGLDLDDPDTLLYFSAHGTPIKYLAAGSRYDGYVEEHCRQIAEALGGGAYTIGYQNHSNRGIAWTLPDNADHIKTLAAKRLVVVPISFVHEQSETLSELDLDFKEEVEAEGMTMHRVPVPHDDPALGEALADLAMPFLRDEAPATHGLHPCRCRPKAGTVCTNGHRTVACYATAMS